MLLVSTKHKVLVEDFDRRDRLSELADPLLIHILSFLPTLDAVKTVLLRRFGNLWTVVTKLNFDSSGFYEPFDDDEKHRFRTFVHNVLLLHQSSIIDSFRLRISIEHYWHWTKEESVVNETHKWIECALQKEPKIVELHFQGNDLFPLPHFLFTNQSVVKLALQGCELKRQPRVHMGSLRNLSLTFVDSEEDEILTEMITGFPSLEKLHMHECDIRAITLPTESIQELAFEDLEYDWLSHSLNCPNITVLDLFGHVGCFEATNLSSVRKASIRFSPTFYGYEKYASKTTDFMKKVGNAEILTFDGVMFQGVSFPENRWKFVNLKNTFGHETHVLCIYNLVRNSPYLEVLTINVGYASEYAEKESDKICEELSFPCVSAHLRKVHIRSTQDHDHQVQLQLAEFLLKSAIVLDKLVISQRGKQLASRNKLNLVKKFSHFSRASSNARITFY